MIAKAMRAILLASATATSLKGLVCMSFFAQDNWTPILCKSEQGILLTRTGNFCRGAGKRYTANRQIALRRCQALCRGAWFPLASLMRRVPRREGVNV